ncbi:bidirectional sugar transporter SWEET14-like [Trifolium pratense]|uniref:bidirectional sugar transporter SWEET14-like n=1 Tax=Trifolium pratense TaxID=57577 RepID=UPI001E691BC3|nr:bidirectional sugar transporter SWEET14-like [Trifolium pratense]XP_045825880.1 bidirectional sugar transporter SWEET14-like [Trifolium pratense]
MTLHRESWAFVFGLLGNVISVMVFLAPLPTFYQIYKKKSTEGFQSVPYVVALLSAMLWIYYALVKNEDSIFLLTINSFGLVVESIYLAIFLVYASNKARLSTIKLILLLNVFGFGAMLVSSLCLATGSKRLSIIGWICLVFNITVFASPLCIIRHVIKTKSVTYMPLSLSFFLSLNAITWFFYGYLLKDYYIALPNTLGFLFGIIQMVMYLIYRNATKVVLKEPTKLHEQNGHININIDVLKIIDTVVLSDPNQVDNSAALPVSTTCEDPNMMENK